MDGSTDGPTDRPTDRPTDQPTDTVTYRSRCPRQKWFFSYLFYKLLQCFPTWILGWSKSYYHRSKPTWPRPFSINLSNNKLRFNLDLTLFLFNIAREIHDNGLDGCIIRWGTFISGCGTQNTFRNWGLGKQPSCEWSAAHNRRLRHMLWPRRWGWWGWVDVRPLCVGMLGHGLMWVDEYTGILCVNDKMTRRWCVRVLSFIYSFNSVFVHE